MSNDILNSLLKEYEQKKLKAELECDERKNNLYRLIPRLQEIDNELNSFAFKTAKNILNNVNINHELFCPCILVLHLQLNLSI